MCKPNNKDNAYLYLTINLFLYKSTAFFISHSIIMATQVPRYVILVQHTKDL